MNAMQNAMSESYRAVMDPSVNPLRRLPPIRRFQTMLFLSMMWTLIFCVGTGAWLWYGELVAFHVLLALGVFVTGTTFHRAGRTSE
ncbi:hypothetical protein [Bauldia litoralis]|uniref:Fatty acid desaturase n=1 Tax=Bauldia litoralis TaxID=665467 RepID=A0A1G6AG36_9HYPH|nr:hypothetical protein [Bauldia litoralis]SDB07344.1 hypothetical protein SAMN02982931_00569 [Bauldia litoralis]